METISAEQANTKHLQRTTLLVNLCCSLLNLTLTFTSVFPFHSGLLLSILVFIANLLPMNPTANSFVLYKHFMNLLLALSPAWILSLDPCALSFAQCVTASNVFFTAIEQREKFWRWLYIALSALSWLFIFLAKSTLLDECETSASASLRRNVIMILINFLQLVLICSVQIDSHLKATKDALAQVTELNSKFEKLNAELKQLLDDKDNFILLFSHETRNPLNILLGNLSLLIEEAEVPQVKNRLVRCKFCADLLLQHLNNILDTGKLANKGTLEMTPMPVKTYEYLQATSSFMDMLVKKKASLKSELMIPQKLPNNLKFDMQRMTQVILNLVTNAVKFTNTGSIKMVVRYLKKECVDEADFYPTTAFGYQLLNKDALERIDSSAEFAENPMGSDNQHGERFRREMSTLEEKRNLLSSTTQEERGFLKIEIHDTGCGIKEEDLTKLFKKFSQVHSEGAQNAIGSGLGLWITKTLCELMHGDIRVYSKPRVGTCFSAIIRADSLPAQTRGSVHLSTVVKTTPSPQRRALIADDDPYNLEVHFHILKELGFDVIETATQGLSLVDKFKSKPEEYFEVVITDVSMPRADGVQAALMIREFESTHNRRVKVKIGFITGYSNPKDKSRCEKEPISAIFYFPKPIKRRMLESFLNNESPLLPHRKRRGSSVSPRDLTCASQTPLVLCVDDDIFNLDCLTEMLRSCGVKTVTATSGEEGLSLFKSLVYEEKKEISFVLMDCRMGGMDGWTASHKLKEMLKAEKKAEIPVIGLTGEDRKRNEEKYAFSGMDELLQKPITLSEIQRLVKKYESPFAKKRKP